MKLNVIAIAMTTILFSCSQNKNTQNVTLEDEIDSTSFAIGVSVGENLNNQFDELDFELVNAGLNSTKDTSNNFGISSMVAQGIIQRYMTKKQLEKQKEVDEFEAWAEAESQKDAYLEGTNIHDSSDSSILAHPGSFPGEKSE